MQMSLSTMLLYSNLNTAFLGRTPKLARMTTIESLIIAMVRLTT